MIEIRRYPACKGCYGERIAVNRKHNNVAEFFKLICVWEQDTWYEDDGSATTLYELPINISVDTDVCIKLALQRLNVTIINK